LLLLLTDDEEERKRRRLMMRLIADQPLHTQKIDPVVAASVADSVVVVPNHDLAACLQSE
jgi:hypothetical protein